MQITAKTPRYRQPIVTPGKESTGRRGERSEGMRYGRRGMGSGIGGEGRWGTVRELKRCINHACPCQHRLELQLIGRLNAHMAE
ncbi:hypothetical protein E2C01_090157 [Portunus trituberculatus]|uniref:Uncharacterized protein n=1 Tax=Portunus trituberculatus TaxID=210409 RepID=A0A5B7JRF5_PORTR|nr:hypothetical protein [Portunus trituberculatus]